ncbi:uncharacterized protein NDAI_0K00660 [Naumovozyma dairenensis CBS 421]|uniref:EamA domain-containing protein n=1 Tax=Naumovozyma dairenensis (strain ATCC 10597 / BCRC 20456 / CBS 421 / NBRC 0211 / NRRL Y-12639) TaxID=1071378 RepID=G0WHJ6_NAUDC|nr:hypothetical protein NDAI_0K00660 [Naumovozyma dairenensis CBS 421]CCD27257.1 hypothetical protein NDAI_0K00660 [Naumovozyma dairenensis CBS 421]
MHVQQNKINFTIADDDYYAAEDDDDENFEMSDNDEPLQINTSPKQKQSKQPTFLPPAPIKPTSSSSSSRQIPITTTENADDSDNDDIQQQSTIQRINKDYLKPNVGLLLLTLAQLFNSLMVTSTKVLETDPYDIAHDQQIKPLQILLVRMVITYLGTLIYMFINRHTIQFVPFGDPKIRKWLILRGCVGFFGVFGMYFSLMYLSISDAVLITFLAPSVTIIMSWVILRERFTKTEAIGCIVSLFGVVLIVRPTFIFGVPDDDDGKIDPEMVESKNPEERLIATFVGLLGVVGMSMVYVVIRFIGKRAHAIMSVSYFSLITTIISFLGIVFLPSMKFHVPHSLKQWLLFANLGFCGFIFQLLLTLGIQKERAGRGSLISYTQLIYAIFWDVTLYRHWPNIWSWCGMLIIIGTTLLIVKLKPKQDENGNVIETKSMTSLSSSKTDLENGMVSFEMGEEQDNYNFPLEEFSHIDLPASDSCASVPTAQKR